MKAARLALSMVLLAGIVLFFALGGYEFLRLEWVRASQAELTASYAARPVQTRAAFFLLYFAAASLSVPGTVVLTIAGGAVLGFWWALVLVSFASSAGATVSFWCARFLFRDALERRLGHHLHELYAGLHRDGPLYLFSLRLIPVVPFFAVNLGMGLTHLRPWTFYWVSQLGMLASTTLYVNAGTQLAAVQTASDIVKPELLVALGLIGALPIAARGMVWWLAERKRRSRPRA